MENVFGLFAALGVPWTGSTYGLRAQRYEKMNIFAVAIKKIPI